MSDNFSRVAFFKTRNVSPTLGSMVTVGRSVVNGRFTGMSSQVLSVLSDRFVEEYKTRAFDRRKTEGAETDFLVPSKKNFIHDTYKHVRSMAV